MKKIRRNVFETNSSSTHSIAIPRHTEGKYPNVVHFGIGEFGWSFDEVYNTADYLYTAILTFYSDDVDKMEQKLDFLKSTLDSRDIRYTFEEPKWYYFQNNQEYKSLDNGYIDHSNELGEFMSAVFSSETTLLDFIFFGIVITGNDNSENPGFLERTEKTVWSDEETADGGWKETKIPNPYYDEKYEEYDWYYKGN